MKFKLSDISSMKYGSLPKHKSVDGQYPIFTGYKTSGYSDEFNVEDPEIVVVARGVGGTGDVKMAPGPAWITNLSIIVRVNPDLVNKKYLQLKLAGMGLRYLDSGSAQSQITIKDLSEVKIDLPDLDVQTKVAKTIQMFEDKISNLQAINDNLVDVLQTVYHNLLLNSKDKPQLENVANLIKDSVKSEKLQAEPYVPIDTIPMHTLFLNEFRPTTDAKSSLIRFNKRDVLFGSMRAYFHRLSIAPFDGVTRTTTFVIRPKNPNMLPELSLALFEDSFINYASATSKGSTMPYASWEAVKNYEIPLFSEADHRRLESLFTKTFEVVHLNNLEISNLTNVRDALLSKLIN